MLTGTWHHRLLNSLHNTVSTNTVHFTTKHQWLMSAVGISVGTHSWVIKMSSSVSSSYSASWVQYEPFTGCNGRRVQAAPYKPCSGHNSSEVKGCLYYDTCAAHVQWLFTLSHMYVVHVWRTVCFLQRTCSSYMYGRGLCTTPFCKVTSLVASFSCYRGMIYTEV